MRQICAEERKVSLENMLNPVGQPNGNWVLQRAKINNHWAHNKCTTGWKRQVKIKPKAKIMGFTHM